MISVFVIEHNCMYVITTNYNAVLDTPNKIHLDDDALVRFYECLFLASGYHLRNKGLEMRWLSTALRFSTRRREGP